METLRNSLIKAVDLKLGFNNVTSITPQPLNFSIPVGNFTALVGTNGSGKTTLLNAILGEPVIQSGGLYLCEEVKPSHLLSAAQISKWTSYVPQEHFFAGHLTVHTFLKIVTDNERSITEVLQKMGIDSLKNKVLTDISSGQRQRVFLARALLQKARVLLLDEPTNHLDPEGKAQFWNALDEFKKNSNLDIFVSTHDLEYVKQYSTLVLALKDGRVEYFGNTKDFFKVENTSKVFTTV